MADAVVKTMLSGRNRIVLNITGIYSTGDSDTNVLDISTLTGPSGGAPTKVAIEELTWSVSPGFDYILLEWDATTDLPIETLSGQGYMDYRPFGNKNPNSAASGYTGDILLTASGGAAGDSFSILLVGKIKD